MWKRNILTGGLLIFIISICLARYLHEKYWLLNFRFAIGNMLLLLSVIDLT